MAESERAVVCVDCGREWERDADGIVRDADWSPDDAIGEQRRVRNEVGGSAGPASDPEYTDWTVVADLHRKTVLDLEAGRWKLASMVAERSEWTVFVDPDYERLRATAEILRERGCDSFVAVHAPPTDLPLRSNAFDRILVGDALDSVARSDDDRPSKRSQRRFLRRLRELLDPDGAAYFKVENRYSPAFYRRRSASELLRWLPALARNAVRPGVRRELVANAGWSLGESKAVLSDAGFRCTDVFFTVGHPSPRRLFSDRKLMFEAMKPEVERMAVPLRAVAYALLWTTGRFGWFAPGFVFRAEPNGGRA